MQVMIIYVAILYHHAIARLNLYILGTPFSNVILSVELEQGVGGHCPPPPMFIEGGLALPANTRSYNNIIIII